MKFFAKSRTKTSTKKNYFWRENCYLFYLVRRKHSVILISLYEWASKKLFKGLSVGFGQDVCQVLQTETLLLPIFSQFVLNWACLTRANDEVVTKFRAGNSLFALLKIIIGTAAAKKVGCSQFSHLANVYLKVIKSLRQNSLKKF